MGVMHTNEPAHLGDGLLKGSGDVPPTADSTFFITSSSSVSALSSLISCIRR